MTLKGTQILDLFPQIEEPVLSKIQNLVLVCLKHKKDPQLPKGIAAKLNLNENSVRGALNELKKQGLVCQPLKKLRISDLNSSGQLDFSLRQRQSYAAKP